MTGLPVFFAAMFLLNITPGPDMRWLTGGVFIGLGVRLAALDA